jgi:hypothetical protein
MASRLRFDIFIDLKQQSYKGQLSLDYTSIHRISDEEK